MGYTILIVDDIESNRKLIKLALKKIENTEFIEAVDGQEALAVMEQQDVDLVMLDLMMPGKDGFEVLRTIKAHEKHNDVPVIVCSAVHGLDSITQALCLGAHDYFTKPLSGDQIAVILPLKVRNALQNRHQKKVICRANEHIENQNEVLELLHAAEERLRNKNIETEAMVNQLKLTQLQLIQQGKLAGIGQLATGVAHEINNPLGFIMSNFEILHKYSERFKTLITMYRHCLSDKSGQEFQNQEDLLNLQRLEKEWNVNFMLEDMFEILKESGEGLHSIRKIVQGLRLFSNMDVLDDFENYDLNAGIRSALMLSHNNISAYAGVKEDLKDIPFVRALKGQINQVLIQMIANAVQSIADKHSEKSGIIEIKTYADADFVYCEVCDNGIGIAQEHLDKIFDPLYTSREGGKRISLGLSGAYDIIVNKHGGAIQVSSTPGLGTRFTITLPYAGFHSK